MISRREIRPGIQECTINLKVLYTKEERKVFEQRWKSFYSSDSHNPEVFKKSGDALIYLSEEILPKNKDSRIPILLMFGNPAPRSVVSGMYFAYEGKGREHRVWRAFRETGLLDIEGDPSEKKRRILESDYKTPFHIGLAVFFSFPTTPSKPPWTGVAGLYKLFGRKATEQLAIAERAHVNNLIKTFLGKRGAIFAFQKDAYEQLSGCGAPLYKLPPTRLIQGAPAKKAIKSALAKVVRRA